MIQCCLSIPIRAGGANLDFFGSAVSLLPSGQDVNLAVASQNWDSDVADSVGKVMTYMLVSGSWVLIRTIESPNPASLEMFGMSVALSGDTSTELVVGAIGFSSSRGTVYHFARPAPPSPPKYSIAHLLTYPPTCPPTYLPIYLPTHLPAYLPTCLPPYPNGCLGNARPASALVLFHCRCWCFD